MWLMQKDKDEGKTGAEVNDSRALQHTGEREMKKGDWQKRKNLLFISFSGS